MLNETQRKLALYWYAVEGFDLVTIAQHFGLTRDQLANEISTVKRERMA